MSSSCACGMQFSMLRRKHHCRYCGMIFCSSCASFEIEAPDFVPRAGSGRRACAPCFRSLQKTVEVQHLIRVFALLPIEELGRLAVCRDWVHAVRVVRRAWRALPGRMSYTPFTSLDRAMLRTNLASLGGHSRLMVQACLALPRASLRFEGRTHSCRELGCECSPFLGFEDVFRILCGPMRMHLLRHNPDLCASLVGSLDRGALVRLIPFLLSSHTASQRRFVLDVVAPICARERTTAYALYFTSRQDVKDALWRHLHALLRRDLQQTLSLMQAIEARLAGIGTRLAAARCPFNPDVVVRDVLRVRQLSSSSRPYLVDLDTSEGVLRVLIKTEPLRQDQLAMVCGWSLQRLGVHIPLYHVFPTETGGWVEILPGQTVYRLQTSILNHILGDAHRTVHDIRTEYVDYLVGFAMFGYVLGLGDRHLENIMIDGTRLYHIDFSFLLGRDPKLSSAHMRLLPGMIEALGPYYDMFLDRLKAAYASVRTHADFYYCLFTYLGCAERARAHVRERLRPASLDEEAALVIEHVVKHSSGDWKDRLGDLTHSMFKLEY